MGWETRHYRHWGVESLGGQEPHFQGSEKHWLWRTKKSHTKVTMWRRYIGCKTVGWLCDCLTNRALVLGWALSGARPAGQLRPDGGWEDGGCWLGGSAGLGQEGRLIYNSDALTGPHWVLLEIQVRGDQNTRYLPQRSFRDEHSLGGGHFSDLRPWGTLRV